MLFLDELSEFARSALEALRQPLEDGRIVIVRSQRVMLSPTQCMLVAASNPCPCGLGDHRCRCSAADLSRHQRRLSGPLLDRIDVTVAVGRPSAQALRDQRAPASAVLREQVVAARERQTRRFAGLGVACNAQMTPRMVRELVGATPSALACSTSSTTATASAPAATTASSASPAPPPTSRAPTSSAPSTSPPRSRTGPTPHPTRPRRERFGTRRPTVRGLMDAACDACLRRTDLVAAVAGSIDVAWREKRGRTARVLALPDADLLGLDRSAAARYERFDAATRAAGSRTPA